MLDLPALIETSRDELIRQLHVEGALWFRGHAIDTPAAFERLVGAFADPTDYIAGISPRRHRAGRVYESTYYPPHLAIELHNELAHLRRWPAIIAFCCVRPAEGGMTPYADGRKILARLGDRTRDELERRRLLYTYTYPPPRPDAAPIARGRMKSWDEAFGTRDRAAIEAACVGAGLAFVWNPDDSLTTHSWRDAVAVHPVTGERVCFNQILLRNAYRLRLRRDREPPVADAILGCTFGDGQPIPREILEDIKRATAACTVALPWGRGDVLVLDNVLVAHGRTAFTGEREVLCIMGQ